MGRTFSKIGMGNLFENGNWTIFFLKPRTSFQIGYRALPAVAGEVNPGSGAAG
jgi:hypothetical protein